MSLVETTADSTIAPARVPTKATPLQVTKIAAAAEVDSRTVRRRLRGAKGASTTDARIDRAIEALGLQHLLATGSR
jgi:hypothetical protein